MKPDLGWIIPTCVGKRPSKQEQRENRADHPHVRGEKFIISKNLSQGDGSSPRAWGKV